MEQSLLKSIEPRQQHVALVDGECFRHVDSAVDEVGTSGPGFL